LAKKNSSLFSSHSNHFCTRSSNYWSAEPSTKDKPEFMILKIHPCLSFVTGISLEFLLEGNMYNCQYVKVSFGFTEKDFYFCTGKIPLEISELEVEIKFNTAFLANYVKVEFYDKNYQQFEEDQNNYYICLNDLKIKGVLLKEITEHKKILYQNFSDMQPAPKDRWETYAENLLFLDIDKFKESEHYSNKLKEMDNLYVLILTQNETEAFLFFYYNHKIFKNFEYFEKIKRYFLEILSIVDIRNLLLRYTVETKSYIFDLYPIFKCFRK